MHLHRGVTAWILVATLTGNFDCVARYVLALLRQNARHVSRRAGSERDEQKLDWRRC